MHRSGQGAWLGWREVGPWELTCPPMRVNGELRLGVVALSPHSWGCLGASWLLETGVPGGTCDCGGKFSGRWGWLEARCGQWGGPRRLGGLSTGDLGWAESLAWSAVQAWGGVGGRLWALRTGSRILQRTALNLWAWTLRPFSKWCCLPLVQ